MQAGSLFFDLITRRHLPLFCGVNYSLPAADVCVNAGGQAVYNLIRFHCDFRVTDNPEHKNSDDDYTDDHCRFVLLYHFFHHRLFFHFFLMCAPYCLNRGG